MRRALVGVLVFVGVGLCAPGALAAYPRGSDPSSNYPPHIPYSTCSAAPTGTKCLTAGRNYLDKARAHLHQPAYKLPANFLKLSANQQVLILTDLDRGLYHLSPIAGLTKELDRNALAGVHADNDPQQGIPGFTNDPNFQYYGSNWAYGYPNILFAYGAWMYDDGPDSPNVGCKKRGDCWGHRHNILLKLPKQFGASGPTAMGAAAGKDHHGQHSYAMLLGRGSSSYHPKYLYKWSERKHWW